MLTGRFPPTILGVRKLPVQILGYPMVKRPHPSAFPRFDTIPECDGRTDRQTDGFAVAYTALAELALRCKKCVESMNNVFTVEHNLL